MATAMPEPQGPVRSTLLVFVTAILLLCCWPVGLIALWFGPWSNRSKVIITVVWLILFGPATFYYGGQVYNHPYSTPSPH